MIDIKLQQDSERRLREIKREIRDAKSAKLVRRWTKELEEEQKILDMIERVEVTVC